MNKIILTTLLSLLCLKAYGNEYLYFGDEHTMKNKFSETIISFLKEPSKSCKNAYLRKDSVLNASSRYATASRWVSPKSGDVVLVKDYLEVPYILDTKRNPHMSAIKVLIRTYGTFPHRRAILAMGNLETFTTKKVTSPAWDIGVLLNNLKIDKQKCLLIAPHPFVKKEFQETRDQYLKDLKTINEKQTIGCQVIFYDEKKHGPLTLEKEGNHLTQDSYEKWAKAITQEICSDYAHIIK